MPPTNPSVHRFIQYTLTHLLPMSSSLDRQTDRQAGRVVCVWQPSVCQFKFITHLAPISHSSIRAGLHAWFVTSASPPPSMLCFIYQPHFCLLSSPILSMSLYDGAEGRKKRRHKKDTAGDRTGGGGRRSGIWHSQHCVDGAWSGRSCSSW